MREKMCRFLGIGDSFERIPSRDAYRITFRFSLTPAEYVGQPDEAQHFEEREITVTVSGLAIRSGAIPKTDSEKVAVLYWHGVKALEAGDDAIEINAEYAAAHPVDSGKIVFPPTRAFPIGEVQKMGFR